MFKQFPLIDNKGRCAYRVNYNHCDAGSYAFEA